MPRKRRGIAGSRTILKLELGPNYKTRLDDLQLAKTSQSSLNDLQPDLAVDHVGMLHWLACTGQQ